MMEVLRKEWNITYSFHDGEGGLDGYFIVLHSFWKVLRWFVAKGRKACYIYIWTSGRVIQELTLEDCDETM